MKVILLMAVTADGMIARDSSQLVDWTGKNDKKYFVELTQAAGVMIMGSKTFDTIGKVLPGRENIVMTRDKSRKSNAENLVFTDAHPKDLIGHLKNQGCKSATVIGGSQVNSLFLAHNLIDEIHLTIVPKIFGKGLTLFNRGFDLNLKLIESKDLGQGHLLVKYRVTGLEQNSGKRYSGAN